MLLVGVVDRQQHLLDHRRELLPQLGLGPQYVRSVHPRLQRRHQGSRVCHQSVSASVILRRASPYTRIDRRIDLGVESLRELELEHRNDLQFVFPNLIVWAGLGEADRLPDEQQEVEGDVLLGAHIPERPPGQTSEPVEDRHVEEVEREVAAFDRLQECIQGQA